ncbi:MAG: flagellar export chaperone FliS [Bdellovibrionales bacterium]|nr:flagellar export chaperone FliS [Bdellovibrionales bacterium]
MSNYGAKAYQQTQVVTASKEKILLMLYESCIRNLKKCREAMVARNFSEKGAALGKAQDIINELCNSLNFDVGGDVARQLEALYNHIFEQTTQANISNDAAKVDHCIKIMETLYSGWKEAIEKQTGSGGAKK